MRTGAAQIRATSILSHAARDAVRMSHESWLFPEKPMAGEAARPGAIQLPFQPHVVGAAELRVLHQQLVGTCAQLDVAARRVHISWRPARDQQLAVDPDVETVVTGAVQDEAAGLGQVPETVPPGAEEPPRQLRVTLQKVKRHVGCDAIDERFSGKF